MKRRTWLVAVLVVLALVAALIGPAAAVCGRRAIRRACVSHPCRAPRMLMLFRWQLSGGWPIVRLATPHQTSRRAITRGLRRGAIRQRRAARGDGAAGLAWPSRSRRARRLASGLYEDILDELELPACLTSINTIADALALDADDEGGPLLQGVGYCPVWHGAFGAESAIVGGRRGQERHRASWAGSLTSGVLYTIVALGTLDSDTARRRSCRLPVNGRGLGACAHRAWQPGRGGRGRVRE